MARPLVVVGLVLLVLAILFLLDRMALAVVRPPRRPPGRTPADLGLRHEDVVVPSAYPLRGWLLESRPDGAVGGPAVVLTHGWAANAGVLVGLAATLVRRGHPVLLYDVRGHGRSEDAPWVTVRHFRDDTEAAARWMARRFPDRPVVLAGHSMGGAAAVLAAAAGAPVAGLVLLAAPADVLEVTAAYIRERGFPGTLMVWLFRPFWRLRIREPYDRLIPERRLPAVAAPVLVVQPDADRRVPEAHARRLARAAGTRVHRVEGADHTEVLDHPETARLLERFLDEVGGG
ncbi:MAG: alpha/beta fold hydrolase [Gemmatimonadota bacterium]